MLRTLADAIAGEADQKALLAAAQHFDDKAASLENEAKGASD